MKRLWRQFKDWVDDKFEGAAFAIIGSSLAESVAQAHRSALIEQMGEHPELWFRQTADPDLSLLADDQRFRQAIANQGSWKN